MCACVCVSSPLYTRIGKMYKLVIHLCMTRAICYGRESCKSFMIEECFEWSEGRDQDVETEIEFVTEQEQGGGEITQATDECKRMSSMEDETSQDIHDSSPPTANMPRSSMPMFARCARVVSPLVISSHRCTIHESENASSCMDWMSEMPRPRDELTGLLILGT